MQCVRLKGSELTQDQRKTRRNRKRNGRSERKNVSEENFCISTLIHTRLSFPPSRSPRFRRRGPCVGRFHTDSARTQLYNRHVRVFRLRFPLVSWTLLFSIHKLFLRHGFDFAQPRLTSTSFFSRKPVFRHFSLCRFSHCYSRTKILKTSFSGVRNTRRWARFSECLNRLWHLSSSSFHTYPLRSRFPTFLIHVLVQWNNDISSENVI